MSGVEKYKAFTLKEMLIKFMAKTGNRFFIRLRDTENLLPYSKAVHSLLSKGYKISRMNEKTIEIAINDDRYVIRRHGSDIQVFEQVIVNEEYRMLLNLVEKSGLRNVPITILDCGSNIGLFSAWILNRVKVKKIVSIEADSENYTFQKSIIDGINGKTKIELLHNAIWSDSESSLQITSDFRDGQQWARNVMPTFKPEVNSVNSISLNQVFDDYLDKEIHILKIDIEGAEKVVFGNEAGFDRILENSKIIAIEIHEEVDSTSMIWSILLSYGFVLEKVGETTFGYKE